MQYFPNFDEISTLPYKHVRTFETANYFNTQRKIYKKMLIQIIIYSQQNKKTYLQIAISPTFDRNFLIFHKT